MSEEKIEIGIIGGSGLYGMAQLTNVEEIIVTTPFGNPSDAITVGILHGRKIAFIPRHGRDHTLSPTDVPYKANIYALKSLGVRYLVSVNACGSLDEACEPGHVVVPDQLYDHTKLRASSFFNKGLVAHVNVADPFSPELSDVVAKSVAAVDGTVHTGGTFITIEGPRFSTCAESAIYRQWGCTIIGMTTSPEAYLAREAEIAYACMAHVTDYDVWHESEQDVTIDMIIATVKKNTKVAQNAISEIVRTMDTWSVNMAAHSALENAFLTNQSAITDEIKQQFGLLIADYF